MALNGVGGNGAGSALDKFQQIRDQAKKKLDGADNRSRLADMLKQKQSELATGGTAAKGVQAKGSSPAAAFLEGLKAMQGSGAQAIAIQGSGGQGAGAQGPQGVSSAYGRAGGLEKTDPKPKLGRYVDFMA